ncbi:hypothetical protein BDZ89DRAFT_1044879 [Hymenopellis radicata]|nr:hypothetical protein BDZ89DRAFT_1044879 [Hymenopellis radicata]
MAGLTVHEPAHLSPLASDASGLRKPSCSSLLVRTTRSPANRRELVRAFTRPTEDSEKSLIRHKFQAGCLQRAMESRRNGSPDNRKSERLGEDDKLLEERKDAMQHDEVCRRIVAHANKKLHCSRPKGKDCRLGWPFGDGDDSEGWEAELEGRSGDMKE